jgi:hypothetical protein
MCAYVCVGTQGRSLCLFATNLCHCGPCTQQSPAKVTCASVCICTRILVTMLGANMPHGGPCTQRRLRGTCTHVCAVVLSLSVSLSVRVRIRTARHTVGHFGVVGKADAIAFAERVHNRLCVAGHPSAPRPNTQPMDHTARLPIRGHTGAVPRFRLNRNDRLCLSYTLPRRSASSCEITYSPVQAG